MANCDLLESCYFYKNELSGMPCTYKNLLYKYCLGDYTKCTRLSFARAYGRNNVPLDMFPNDVPENLIMSLSQGRKEEWHDQGNLS